MDKTLAHLESLGLIEVIPVYELALASGDPVPLDVGLRALGEGYDVSALEGNNLEIDD